MRILLALFPEDTSRTQDSDELWHSLLQQRLPALQEKNHRQGAVVPDMVVDPRMLDAGSVLFLLTDQLPHCGVFAPVYYWTCTLPGPVKDVLGK